MSDKRDIRRQYWSEEGIRAISHVRIEPDGSRTHQYEGKGSATSRKREPEDRRDPWQEDAIEGVHHARMSQAMHEQAHDKYIKATRAADAAYDAAFEYIEVSESRLQVYNPGPRPAWLQRAMSLKYDNRSTTETRESRFQVPEEVVRPPSRCPSKGRGTNRETSDRENRAVPKARGTVSKEVPTRQARGRSGTPARDDRGGVQR